MTNPEQLQPTFKELSKIITGLFLILIAMSCYVIQRSYAALFIAQFADTEFSNIIQKTETTQAEFAGLKFQYGTMNILWPVVLLILSLIIKFLAEKQACIWKILQKSEELATLNFDALNIYRQILIDKTGRVILVIVAYLPLFALLAHLVAGSWMLFIFMEGSSFANKATLHILKPQAVLQIAVSLAAIGLTIGVPRFLVALIRRYKIPFTKEQC